MRPDVYTQSFRRALFHYANNGFTSRYLDAEDHAFIEAIRERGYLACGSLADVVPTLSSYDHSPCPVMLAELEYWDKPYAREREVYIRTYPNENAEDRAIRMAKRRADRLALAAERERQAKAWRDEQQAALEERQRRQLRTLVADIEWEKADPHKMPTRHYVPEWRRDAERAKKRAKQRLKDIAKAKAEAKQNLDATRHIVPPKPQPVPKPPQSQPQPQPTNIHARAGAPSWPHHWPMPLPGHANLFSGLHVFVRDADVGMLMVLHSEQLAFAERRDGVSRFYALRPPFAPGPNGLFERPALMQAIVAAMKGSGMKVWSVEALMEATNCPDRDLLLRAAQDLAGAGYIFARRT
jgi:hypothetical protein